MDDEFRNKLKNAYFLRLQETPNYSLTIFAKDLGLSQPFLVQLLNGRRKITLETGFKISKKIYSEKAQQLEFLVSILLNNSKSKELKLFISSFFALKGN